MATGDFSRLFVSVLIAARAEPDNAGDGRNRFRKLDAASGTSYLFIFSYEVDADERLRRKRGRSGKVKGNERDA